MAQLRTYHDFCLAIPLALSAWTERALEELRRDEDDHDRDREAQADERTRGNHVMNDQMDSVLKPAIAAVRASRDRGVSWILNRLASNGEPVGARERNGWARVPWALAVSGESEAAAAVLAWSERGQLTPDGFFAEGPALGPGRFPAYPMAHLAIGAWLTERSDTAVRIMNALRQMQDAHGGLPISMPGTPATDTSDLLSTAQAGQAAVICGQDDVAQGAYRWVRDLLSLQPADAGSRFYTFRRNGNLLVEPESALAWPSITDFSRARQTFYTAGMAAVFLATFGARYGVDDAVVVSRDLLQRNIDGCEEQFNDPESVQVCKFGWGAAVVYSHDRSSDLLPHLVRMGEWFSEHQAQDGSWSPSTFLVPEPSDVDKLIKTAEHVMEVNAILAALGTARGRQETGGRF
jgi:hypothetical protein